MTSLATPQSTTPPVAGALGPARIAALAISGAVLWFLAALLMRAIGPLGAFHGMGVIILYGLIIPGTVPFVWLTRVMGRSSGGQTLLSVTIVTASATFLDATALTWFPSLYGANPLGAAAAIFWGVGVGLVLGVVMDQPARR